jgi:hypothetical protein
LNHERREEKKNTNRGKNVRTYTDRGEHPQPGDASILVRWLGKARQAYEASGRMDEWRAYLEGLITQHQRKYSLRPQLEDLRK